MLSRMRSFPDPFTAAVVQWSPSVNDAARGTARACEAIAEAATQHGARLIVFPEAWLTGYPYFEGLGPGAEYRRIYRDFVDQAVVIDGPEMQAIRRCAADHGVYVVMGLNERNPIHQAVYNTIAFIGPDGSLLGKHRKMVATITEKLVWTNWDGSDLAAYDTPLGRLGGMICYEHLMAPARYICCDLGVQVHIAVWPGYAFMDPVVDSVIRSLSMENACFVISAREVMSRELLPAGTPFGNHPNAWEAHGGSSIVAPGAVYVTEPVFHVETIVTGTINVPDLIDVKWWSNGVGNYSRPDIFRVIWDSSPKPPVERI